MSFFGGVKKFFGVSDDVVYEEDEIDDESIINTTAKREPYVNPFKKEQKETSANNIAVTTNNNTNAQVETKVQPEIPIPTTVPEDTLQRIVEILNANLPEYIKKCLDVEAQKRYLCEVLGDSFKSFANDVKEKSLMNEKNHWESEIRNAEQKITALSTEVQELKSKSEEVRSKLTISETQRRAMNEKVQAADAKAAKAEAEVEQYELENKSLLNKLKVVQVKTDDVDYFKKENEDLLAQINKLKVQLAQGGTSSATAEEDAKTIESLKAEVANLTESMKEVETLKEENAKLAENAKENETLAADKDKEIEGLNAQNADLKKEIDITVTLVNSLREKLAKQEAEAKEIASQPAADNAEVEELKNKLLLSTQQIQSLEEELEEANNSLEVVNQVQEQLDKVEEMKKHNDEKVKSLNEKISSQTTQIDSLNNEIQSLKDSLKEKDTVYSAKIKEISKRYEAKIAEEQQKKKTPKKDNFDMTMLDSDVAPKETLTPENVAEILDMDILDEIEPAAKAEESNADDFQISAIDDLNEDWMLPSPPTPPTAVEPEPENEDDDKKNKAAKEIDDSLQMSLF